MIILRVRLANRIRRVEIPVYFPPVENFENGVDRLQVIAVIAQALRRENRFRLMNFVEQNQMLGDGFPDFIARFDSGEKLRRGIVISVWSFGEIEMQDFRNF